MRVPDFVSLNPGYACYSVMAGLVPAIHVFSFGYPEHDIL
jgi:hypothetical protein